MPYIKFNRDGRYADAFAYQPQVVVKTNDVLEVSQYVADMALAGDDPNGIEVDAHEAATFQSASEEASEEGDEASAASEAGSAGEVTTEAADDASTAAPLHDAPPVTESEPITTEAFAKPSQPDTAAKKTAAKRGKGKRR